MFNIEKICIDSMKGFEEAFKDRPKLIEMYKKNFVLVDSKIERLEDGRIFIPPSVALPHAQWHRDATTSVTHLLPFCSKDEQLSEIIKGVSSCQAFYMKIDPYANSMKRTAEENIGWNDKYPACLWVNERKYELDCQCYMLRLAYLYYKNTADASVFTKDFRKALDIVLDLWEREQHHTELSNYRFERENCPPTDTLPHEGKGNPVGYTGMIWSGFRPSDDATVYGYLVPSNMFAAAVLGQMSEIARYIWKDSELVERMLVLKSQIEDGIRKYAVVNHEKYGEIFAYETDGLGNCLLMDDGFTPNLISAPYFGYCDYDDPIYLNTKRFIFSEDNPMFSKGTLAEGVGSVHESIYPKIVHIGVLARGLTTTDPDELERVFNILEISDNGSMMMKESFHPSNPADYTWEDFCWPSAMFCELLYRYANGILPSSIEK